MIEDLVLKVCFSDGKRSPFYWPLKKGVLSVGRAIESKLHLDHPQISRKHCSIKVNGDEVFLVDHASSCGSYVDGQKLAPKQQVKLNQGSFVALGNQGVCFQVLLVDEYKQSDLVYKVVEESCEFVDEETKIVSIDNEPSQPDVISDSDLSQKQLLLLQMNSQVDGLKRVIVQLTKQRDQLNQYKAALSGEEEKYIELVDKIKTKKAAIAELKSQETKLKHSVKEAQQTKTSFQEEIHQEHKRLKSELSQKRDLLEIEHKKELIKLEQEISKKEVSIIKLNKSFASIEINKDNLVSKNELLCEKIKKNEEQIISLNSELTQKYSEIKNIDASIHSMNIDLKKLQVKCSQKAAYYEEQKNKTEELLNSSRAEFSKLENDKIQAQLEAKKVIEEANLKKNEIIDDANNNSKNIIEKSIQDSESRLKKSEEAQDRKLSLLRRDSEKDLQKIQDQVSKSESSLETLKKEQKLQESKNAEALLNAKQEAAKEAEHIIHLAKLQAQKESRILLSKAQDEIDQFKAEAELKIDNDWQEHKMKIAVERKEFEEHILGQNQELQVEKEGVMSTAYDNAEKILQRAHENADQELNKTRAECLELRKRADEYKAAQLLKGDAQLLDQKKVKEQEIEKLEEEHARRLDLQNKYYEADLEKRKSFEVNEMSRLLSLYIVRTWGQSKDTFDEMEQSVRLKVCEVFLKVRQQHVDAELVTEHVALLGGLGRQHKSKMLSMTPLQYKRALMSVSGVTALLLFVFVFNYFRKPKVYMSSSDSMASQLDQGRSIASSKFSTEKQRFYPSITSNLLYLESYRKFRTNEESLRAWRDSLYTYLSDVMGLRETIIQDFISREQKLFSDLFAQQERLNGSSPDRVLAQLKQLEAAAQNDFNYLLGSQSLLERYVQFEKNYYLKNFDPDNSTASKQ